MSTEQPDRAALWAQVSPEGRIAVRVTPKARAARIFLRAGVVQVHVTAAPEKGRATAAVQAALADALGVPKSGLSLLRGDTAREKLFQLDPSLSGRRI